MKIDDLTDVLILRIKTNTSQREVWYEGKSKISTKTRDVNFSHIWYTLKIYTRKKI